MLWKHRMVLKVIFSLSHGWHTTFRNCYFSLCKKMCSKIPVTVLCTCGIGRKWLLLLVTGVVTLMHRSLCPWRTVYKVLWDLLPSFVTSTTFSLFLSSWTFFFHPLCLSLNSLEPPNIFLLEGLYTSHLFCLKLNIFFLSSAIPPTLSVWQMPTYSSLGLKETIFTFSRKGKPWNQLL